MLWFCFTVRFPKLGLTFACSSHSTFSRHELPRVGARHRGRGLGRLDGGDWPKANSLRIEYAAFSHRLGYAHEFGINSSIPGRPTLYFRSEISRFLRSIPGRATQPWNEARAATDRKHNRFVRCSGLATAPRGEDNARLAEAVACVLCLLATPFAAFFVSERRCEHGPRASPLPSLSGSGCERRHGKAMEPHPKRCLGRFTSWSRRCRAWQRYQSV